MLPVNFALSEQAVVFRTGQDSPLGEDLRTGIADADYVVAFEVDEISPATREGWTSSSRARLTTLIPSTSARR